MYIEREIEATIDAKLKQGKVILVTGARQVGKTTTLKHHLGDSFNYVSLENPRDYLLAKEDAMLFFESKELPLIIGEAQRVPELQDLAIDWDSFYSDYVAAYLERDVRDSTNVRDEAKFYSFMVACAARTGQLLNTTDIGNVIDVDHKTPDENPETVLHGHWVRMLSDKMDDARPAAKWRCSGTYLRDLRDLRGIEKLYERWRELTRRLVLPRQEEA